MKHLVPGTTINHALISNLPLILFFLIFVIFVVIVALTHRIFVAGFSSVWAWLLTLDLQVFVSFIWTENSISNRMKADLTGKEAVHRFRIRF